MKKLLLVLGMFSFLTVMAVSSSSVRWSGILVSPSGDVSSNTEIHCVETGSTVFTNTEGEYSDLVLRASSQNTLTFKSSSGQSLGSQSVYASSSDMSDQILQTQQ